MSRRGIESAESRRGSQAPSIE